MSWKFVTSVSRLTAMLLVTAMTPVLADGQPAGGQDPTRPVRLPQIQGAPVVIDTAYVDIVSGEIRIRRVTVGQDTGTVINPDGVRHQIHGNVIQTLSRTMKERVRFTNGLVASKEWGSYPILTFPELPAVDVVLIDRQGEPPLGAGESASLPGAAAISNALFDATGVRFRAPPFTPEVVRAALQAAQALAPAGHR